MVHLHRRDFLDYYWGLSLAMVCLAVLVINTFCSLSILKTLKKPPPGDTGVMKKKKKEGEVERNTGKQGSRGVKVEDGGGETEQNE